MFTSKQQREKGTQTVASPSFKHGCRCRTRHLPTLTENTHKMVRLLRNTKCASKYIEKSHTTAYQYIFQNTIPCALSYLSCVLQRGFGLLTNVKRRSHHALVVDSVLLNCRLWYYSQVWWRWKVWTYIQTASYVRFLVNHVAICSRATGYGVIPSAKKKTKTNKTLHSNGIVHLKFVLMNTKWNWSYLFG